MPDGAGYLFVPREFDREKHAGIVVLFPDGRKTEEEMLASTGMLEVAPRENLIVFVFPSRIIKRQPNGCLNRHWNPAAVANVSDTLMAFVERYELESADVFLIGESKGGTAVDRYINDGLYPRPIAVVTASTRYFKDGAEPTAADELCAMVDDSRAAGRFIEYEPVYPGKVPRLEFTPRGPGLGYDGGPTESNPRPFRSVAQRYEALRSAHHCGADKKEPREGGGAECWTYDCRTPLTVCELDVRFWNADVQLRARARDDFDYPAEIWRFLSSARANSGHSAPE